MTWLRGILADGAVWIVAIVGAIGTALLALRRAEQRGKREAIMEGKADAAERVQKGAAAVADGRKRGTLDDRLRHNDGRW
jgi:hypothetical protein